MEESIISLNSTNITDNILNSPKTNNSNETIKYNRENSISEINLKIISSIASNLEDIINDNYNMYYHLISKKDNFSSIYLPCISIEDYLKRIFYYCNINISTLILAIVYIDNFCQLNGYILTLNNIYRIIMASCLLSIKFNEDICYANSFYAKVGSYSVELLNNLEYEFYIKINFNLLVKESYYEKYFNYFSRNC